MKSIPVTSALGIRRTQYCYGFDYYGQRQWETKNCFQVTKMSITTLVGKECFTCQMISRNFSRSWRVQKNDDILKFWAKQNFKLTVELTIISWNRISFLDLIGFISRLGIGIFRSEFGIVFWSQIGRIWKQCGGNAILQLTNILLFYSMVYFSEFDLWAFSSLDFSISVE